MKELTKTYSILLQDKRVKSEQAKYEVFTRQRNTVLAKYRKVFQAFNDLINGLVNAESFYSEMKNTVESLEKNVETFVSNRRSEGAQLLHRIEHDRASSTGGQADRERDRLQQLMERMSVETSSSSPTKPMIPRSVSKPEQPRDLSAPKSTPISSPNYLKQPSSIKSPDTPASFHSGTGQASKDQVIQTSAMPVTRDLYQSATAVGGSDPYNPMAYPYQSVVSPSPAQPTHVSQLYSQHGNQYIPQGYVPPPPPPGPPPHSQLNLGNPAFSSAPIPGGYVNQPRPRSSVNQSQNDHWAGLNAWK